MSFLGKENDAVSVAPDIHRVIFENEKVRMLDVVMKIGDKVPLHWHPANINYILSGGKIKFIKPTGENVELELQAGQTTSADSEVMHAVENNGPTNIHTIQIEFKK